MISIDETPAAFGLRLTVASAAALRVPPDVAITTVRTLEPDPTAFRPKTIEPPTAGVVSKAGRFSDGIAAADAELARADTVIDAVAAPETATVPAPETRI